MNILVDGVSVLHKKWRKFIKNYRGIKWYYLVLPCIYILVVLIAMPRYEIYEKKLVAYKYDAYQELKLTQEDKIALILDKYHLTKNEFKVLCAVVLSEAQGGSYEDAYAVINTIYNRTHAKNWVRSVNGHFGKGKGKSMYYQAISPGQFTVYKSGSYKRHLNDTKSVGYSAIIDFLYTEDIMHNYLSFRSHSIKIKNSESFSNKGNNYFTVLKEENRI